MSDQMGLPSEGTRGKQVGAADRIFVRMITGIHRTVLRRTRGRMMNTMGGNPVQILTTIGRKTGRPRRHPVITVEDGADVLVVATNGGAANHPMWLRNITANPDVRLSRDGQEIPMRATILSPEQKRELWPKLVAAYRTYDTMQGRTNRDIPVVRLTATR